MIDFIISLPATFAAFERVFSTISLCEIKKNTTSPDSLWMGTMSTKHLNGLPKEN